MKGGFAAAVCAAGSHDMRPISLFEPEHLRASMDANLTSALTTTRLVAKAARKEGCGVVWLSSVAAIHGNALGRRALRDGRRHRDLHAPAAASAAELASTTRLRRMLRTLVVTAIVRVLDARERHPPIVDRAQWLSGALPHR